MGTDLIGAIGKDKANQDKINRAIVRQCATDILTPDQCEQHGKALAAEAAAQQPASQNKTRQRSFLAGV